MGNRILTSTFLFREFPKDHRANEMYRIFEDHGELDKVIIPSKRDIKGKMYGFARVFNIHDKRVMTKKLNNIFIGKRKICRNLPKF